MQPGQIVLFRFPHTDFEAGKLRPAVVLGKLPGRFGDWLVSMVSSQLHLEVAGFDDVVREDDADYLVSGLKAASLVRVGRLAVAEEGTFIGAIGRVAPERLRRIKRRLAEWLAS
ncbi:type II toxin-antitoxin system PemK/MazF family toxin [candidate division WOR-3 bacterium]|uniref:Type II toxin-antitoxin system PemK/MazF family toxin n=1 Tax=candidate division WOR-3 bacterium TaxID=2052148 RepID=A0A937XJ24_UNCW3|nr:type II toxin-antitoxin system PemK/MazF family toxin [candidate division WOR-3 bacterium]